MPRHLSLKHLAPSVLVALVFSLLISLSSGGGLTAYAASTSATSARAAFAQASQETGVPASVLKALCYMEGRLGMHGGNPSIDGGYGCMHLVKNEHADTLDQAARLLHVSAQQVKTNLATNIRGGAAVLRAYAQKLSGDLPGSLAGWYGVVAAYSNATVRSTALMYADNLYKLLNTGFNAQTDSGEVVTLAGTPVKPEAASASVVGFSASALPAGCTMDNKVDYPGAVDCILDPSIFDCNVSSFSYPGCTYESAHRPGDFAVDFISVHDIEGTAQDSLNVFQNHNSGVSVHYVVDSDGTVYQLLHDQDIGYHVGNYWANQHSIGIEHAGFDATGFQWYNAAEYLGSAKLMAYLLKKYNLPLDRAHVVAHGTVPAPQLAINHVDPGPYWLWDYYFMLIHQQGIPYVDESTNEHVIKLAPATDQQPYNDNGTETPANFNFFYLYNGPSTTSGLIPHVGNGTDITDETSNVEPGMNYYYLSKVKDPAGSGSMMYEIWYGEYDQAHANPTSLFQTAHLVWLAVPRDAAVPGEGIAVTLMGPNGGSAAVYSNPITDNSFHTGDAPTGAVFVSGMTVVEDGTTNVWYQISFHHRFCWVPASEVTIVRS
ncbi:MAG TPA: N-acetylmuramoyl-L-alanine amidase [Ktedonobacteraceae bacterium]|nr:N-acetylmuramoyl-L-alanine amidase [Ktedonobacteraceae bacterium]